MPPTTPIVASWIRALSAGHTSPTKKRIASTFGYQSMVPTKTKVLAIGGVAPGVKYAMSTPFGTETTRGCGAIERRRSLSTSEHVTWMSNHGMTSRSYPSRRSPSR